MNDWYHQKIKFLKAKRNTETDKLTVKRLNREIENYERHIRQTEPTGVDKYLN